MNDNNKKLTMEIQADVFQALIKHLQNKTEVQNIDLMNLADFCRNCLSKWYVTAAKERGMEISYEEARDLVYGMPYSQWKAQHQPPATAEQLEAFAQRAK